MLSIEKIQQTLNPYEYVEPEDDFRILDSWVENGTNINSNKSELMYMCYKIQVVDPGSRKQFTVYKAIRFAKVDRIPKAMKQSTSLMDMQSQVLSAAWQENYNLVTMIANIIHPVTKGLLFLYGVQGVANTIEEAKKICNYDYEGFVRAMMGTFRTLHLRNITADEAAWLHEKMRGMKCLTAVRGIPKASKSGEDAGDKGIGGANVNPDSQGTLEEIITALADYEYVIEVLSTPVTMSTIRAWSNQIEKEMTDWNEQLQGTKSISANLSLPISYMTSAGQAKGWSHSLTDSRTVSYNTGESYTTGTSSNVGHSLSQSIGKSFGINEGHSVSVSNGSSHSISNGQSQGHSTGTTNGITRGQTVGQTIGETLGISKGYTQGVTKGHSVGTAVSLSKGTSQGTNSGTSMGNSIGFSQNQSLSSGRNQSLSQNTSESQSFGSSRGVSSSQSLGKSFGKSSSLNHSVGSGTSDSYGTSRSDSASFSDSYGKSHSASHQRGWNAGYSQGSTSSNGSSTGTGISANNSTSNTSGWGVHAGASFVGGNYNRSSSDSNGNGININSGNSHTEGSSSSYTHGQNGSEGYSNSTTENHGQTTGTSVGQTNSHGISSSESYSSGTGRSYAENFGSSYGENRGISVSNGKTIGSGQTIGSSLGYSSGSGMNTGMTAGSTSGSSRGASTSISVSQNSSDSSSTSMSQSVSQSQSVSNSQSMSNSLSNSYSESSSDSTGISQSVSDGTSQSTSTGDTSGQSWGVNESNGTGQSWSDGTSESTGRTSGRSQGESQGESQGNTMTQNFGASGSMGIGPSIGYSKSYQWMDQRVKDILEVLEYQNNRMKKGLREGAFYTYVYIACPDDNVLAAAQAAARSTWQNEFALAQPVQALDLTQKEQQHLLYHFSAFSSDVTRENFAGAVDYKYATILTADEYVAYTHLPRISEGGIDADIEDIPHFRVPGMMDGDIYMGKEISAERYTFNNGYRTQFNYKLNIDELMHGVFTGQSRSGKTVAAMRFVRELINSRRTGTGKRMRIVIMDPKQDWRGIARYVEPERFHFYSMGNPYFEPICLNPCKIPVGVEPQYWVDGIVNIYCRAYGLLERGKQMIADSFYDLYEKAGVFKHDDDRTHPETWHPQGPDWTWEKEISWRSGKVTFHKLYKKMNNMKEDSLSQRAGNDTKDAYARLTERLSCFAREYSIEYRLFSKEDKFDDPNSVGLGKGIDELIGADDVTVFESFGLESTFANFIFGVITSGFYKVAKSIEKGYLNPSQYETVLVIEEANKVLTGSDVAGSAGKGSDMSLSGQSEFEEILDQSAGYGLFVIAITQKISSMPSSIVANCGLLFAGRLSQPTDVDLVVRMIGREGRVDDRDVVKFFPKIPTGWFICRSNRAYDFRDSEPVLVQIEPLNNASISNVELEETLERGRMAQLRKQLIETA